MAKYFLIIFTLILLFYSNGSINAEESVVIPTTVREAPPSVAPGNGTAASQPVKTDNLSAGNAGGQVVTGTSTGSTSTIQFKSVVDAKAQAHTAEQKVARINNANLDESKAQQVIADAANHYIRVVENQTSLRQKVETRVTEISAALTSLAAKTDPASMAQKKAYEAEIHLQRSTLGLASAQVEAASTGSTSCPQCASYQKEIDTHAKTVKENQTVVGIYDANNKLTTYMAQRKADGASEKELDMYQKQIDLNTALLACPVSCENTPEAKEKVANAQYNLTLAKSNLAIEQQRSLAREKVKLCNWGICVGNKQSNQSIESIAEKIIRFLARVIASLAVLSFMIGGVMMMIRIDDEGRAQGKKIMTSSVIAVIVVFSAYVIVTFVQQVLYSLGK